MAAQNAWVQRGGWPGARPEDPHLEAWLAATTTPMIHVLRPVPHHKNPAHRPREVAVVQSLDCWYLGMEAALFLSVGSYALRLWLRLFAELQFWGGGGATDW